MNIRNFFKTFLIIGQSRTVRIKKNIIASFGLKGFSILVGFLLVPLTLNYLSPLKYGIWLTLSSIIGWFGFFDIGLGNGLRNKLAEAFALKDYKLSKIYISTTYAALSIIIGSVYVLFFIMNSYLNWAIILNTSLEMSVELNCVAMIVFSFFALRFVLKLIGVILTADQLPAYNSIFDSIGNIFTLIAIYIVTTSSKGSLLYVSIIYTATPVIVLIIASFYFFNGKYKVIKPSIKYIDFKYLKPLAGLGVKFFLLQIAVIIIFSTDNLIITQILGPAEVIPYNIAFKYFGIPIMIFSIILTPFWSAFTDSISKNDIKWIKTALTKLISIWFLVVVVVIIMLVFSKYFYIMWIGDKVYIPFVLSVYMGFYAVLVTWNTIFSYFLNGAGKIKLQMYDGILAMIINIPISIFLAKNIGMGSTGVILGTCISLATGSLLIPIQTKKIISGSAKGIWNK
ncbi:MAG: polysaccharide biosynthesis protein [Bacteroidetes bacterium]|nr:polysaccharide biosynthesis protein [Bacteroidota bacterium]